MQGRAHRLARARVAGSALAIAVCAAAAVRAQSVEAVVREATARGLRVAVCARDVDRGALVFAHHDAEPMLPASNQKLLVALAVLDGLGAEYRFTTGFAVERGRLVVRAGGDPNWSSDGPVDPRAEFGRVARALRAAGVAAVRGVDIEVGPFTGPARPASWPSNQLGRAYCAPTGGVVLERGCWTVEIAPGNHDAVVQVIAPPAGLRLAGRIEMTENRRRGGIYHLEVREGTLAMRGHYWTRGGVRRVRGAVDEPIELFRRSLEHVLADAGVAIDPAAPVVDLELPDVTSPLEPALVRMLHDSSNFDAEQLLRVLGAELAGDGSFAGGLRALRARLEAQLGPLPDPVALADGSGLSRENRTSARFLCDLLLGAARGPHAAAFVAALPLAGQDGTLEDRFDDSALAGRVRAKTGTLAGVSALSGYVQTEDERLVAFSILMEWDRPVKGTTPRAEQERIVAALEHAE